MHSDTQTMAHILYNSSLKVLLYQGQDDIIVNTPGALQWIEKLRFPGNENNEFRYLDFGVWNLKNGTIAGYYKTANKLEFYVVIKSGHMVPADQPQSALELIAKFIAA